MCHLYPYNNVKLLRKFFYINVNVSGKVIVDPHPAANQHQNLTTYRELPLAHAYHVWSKTVNAIVSYPAYRQNDRRIKRLRQPWRSKYLANVEYRYANVCGQLSEQQHFCPAF